ncbi:hypothetical protein [Phaeobacter sp. HF9A]|uniref:hypothetical protein n=1 Tax=Phaeobacter sp. HF9A TaxID=2721561 RepID=UPI00142FB63E|nr:hypothetical protein [Phaeobacter sp. HF9A]NIZ15463.1 hypothetical protein [Phaeobacter sp. HF9A]
MPWYNTDYRPRLPNGSNLLGPEAQVNSDEYNVDAMKRPKFHENVRYALEQETPTRTGVALNGYPVLYYQCASCGQYGEGHLMHVGHKVNWKKYIKDQKPLTHAAAVAAYNDLDNLAYEHAVCNTSHRFETEEEIPDPEAVFNELIAQYIDPVEVGNDVIRINGNPIRLADGATRHRQTTQQAVFDFETAERPDWYPNTRAAMIKEWDRLGYAKPATNRDGKTIVLYWCKSCRHWCEAFSMQLGHNVRWADYAQSIGATTKAQVYQAFNDLENLSMECACCNQGHEWEEWDEDAPEFSITGASAREIRNAEAALAREEAQLLRANLPDHDQMPPGQELSALILLELKIMEWASLRDPRFSQSIGTLKSVPVHFIESATLELLLAGALSIEQDQITEETASVARLEVKRFQDQYVDPFLATCQELFPALSGINRDQLNAFKGAVYGQSGGDVVLGQVTLDRATIESAARHFKVAMDQAETQMEQRRTGVVTQITDDVLTGAVSVWAELLAQAANQGLQGTT